MSPKRITTNGLLAVFLGISMLFVTPTWAMERQFLKGYVPAVAARLQPVGRLPGARALYLAIALPLRSPEALSNLLEQLYDPTSTQYRHYLTPEQFAERFGPTQKDYDTVRVWAESQGLVVTGTHPNRTLLDFSGSVEDIERALHVTMRI